MPGRFGLGALRVFNLFRASDMQDFGLPGLNRALGVGIVFGALGFGLWV